MKTDRKFPRSHQRINVQLPIHLSATDTAGQSRCSEALILNLSRGGAAIQLSFDAAPEKSVTIFWQDRKGSHQVIAKTRWKTIQENNWRIGVETLEESRQWKDLLYFACQTAAQ